VSAVDRVEAWERARMRVAELDDRIRAVITWIGPSRNDAELAQRRLVAGQTLGPLDGMLIGLKDNIDTAGIRTTAGAKFLADNVPSVDATVVRLLREAGAVVVAKLNMAELAWGATTQNATYGSCRNPWDLTRIPGGSSGGSGAAVAMRYCEASLGTDTGASVRIPASVNGVVGLRPTFGSISNFGVFPAARTQDTVGPMARTAVEAAHLAEVLTRYDPADPYARADSGPAATSALGEPVRGLRIGVPETFFFDDLDLSVAEHVEAFLGWLDAAGATIVKTPDFGQADAAEHWTRIVECEAASFHRNRLKEHPEQFSIDVRERISKGLTVTAAEFASSLDWRMRYRRRLAMILADLDAIVTPVVPTDVPTINGYDSRAQTAALGRITYPWALHLGPTLSLPVGFHSQSGMPVGVALAAAQRAEATLFRIAAAYQEVTDWHLAEPAASP
jgi:aspartyl-tRNA(Asn)/glutamyl-tRNA(Gln) amidotransferase subunit A